MMRLIEWPIERLVDGIFFLKRVMDKKPESQFSKDFFNTFFAILVWGPVFFLLWAFVALLSYHAGR